MNSDPAINTQVNWLLGLIQAADNFYPTGAYAHSYGLEGLVEAGVVHDRATLRRFLLNMVLPQLHQIEIPLATHAWEALGTEDWSTLRQICILSAALRAPRELREAAEAMGRQRAHLAQQLHPSPLADTFWKKSQEEKWPHCLAVATALEARLTQAPVTAVYAAVIYAAVAGVIAAAMKLLRLGQNGAQTLLTEVLATGSHLTPATTHRPLQAIGWFNPWMDIASARHETAAARLFIS